MRQPIPQLSLLLIALVACSSNDDTDTDTGETETETESGTDTDTGREVTSVYDIQRELIPEGATVFVAGLRVVGVSQSGLHVQDPAGGEYSGIYLWTGGGGLPVAVRIGDEVDCDGVIWEYQDPGSSGSVTLIDAREGLATITDAGAGELAPVEVPAADLLDPDLGEAWESVLVRVTDATVADPNLEGGEWELEGGLHVDDRLYSFDEGIVIPGITFSSIDGVVWYSSDAFKLEPRSADDFTGYVRPDLPDHTVYEIQGGDVDEGTGLEVLGVRVTGIDDEAIFVQEVAGGPLSGILVDIGSAATGFALGDEVKVVGFYEEDNNGNTIISIGAGEVVITTAGAGELAPEVVDTADLDGSTGEDWEGVLVQIRDVTVADPDIGNGQWLVDDGVAIDDLMYVFQGGELEAGATFTSITGTVHYAGGRYRVEPRNAADFEGFVAAPPSGADRLKPGDIVVTEIMYNPSVGGTCADTDCEWIEIYNDTNAEIDLDKLDIELYSDAGALIDATVVSGETLVPAWGYAVLAATDGTGSGWTYPFTPDGTWGTFALSNSSNRTIVVGNRDGAVDTAALYDSGLTAGVSWQVSWEAATAAANDDMSAWCASTTEIAETEDFGTPGAPNHGCD